MRTVAYKQVDVFTTRPFMGNPVAVVLDADGLSDEEMQRIARWTNLSETTFVLPSAVASYRLRIFTPARELSFAGHPTVGSAHAVLEAGLASAQGGTLTQECLAGVIALRAEEGRITARVPAPPLLRETVVPAERLSALLGVPVVPEPAPLAVDVGPVWLVALVASPEALAAAVPDLAGVAALSADAGLTGLTAFALVPPGSGDARVHVRSFAPGDGVPEDPVCGSGNASVGAYLGATGLLSQTGRSYLAAQGMQMQRDGRVAVSVHGPDHVEIGGPSVTVLDGTIRLD